MFNCFAPLALTGDRERIMVAPLFMPYDVVYGLYLVGMGRGGLVVL